MLLEEIKNIKSDRKKLREFGITIGIVLSLLGVFLLVRKKDYFYCFILFSILFFFCGFALPFVLKIPYRLWMALAAVMGWVMSRIILGILFYVVLTPIGLFLRMAGKDFLNLKFDRKAKSYWAKINDYGRRNKSYYERQY